MQQNFTIHRDSCFACTSNFQASLWWYEVLLGLICGGLFKVQSMIWMVTDTLLRLLVSCQIRWETSKCITIRKTKKQKKMKKPKIQKKYLKTWSSLIVNCTVLCSVHCMLNCNTPRLAGVCQLFGYFFAQQQKRGTPVISWRNTTQHFVACVRFIKNAGSLPAILKDFIL